MNRLLRAFTIAALSFPMITPTMAEPVFINNISTLTESWPIAMPVITSVKMMSEETAVELSNPVTYRKQHSGRRPPKVTGLSRRNTRQARLTSSRRLSRTASRKVSLRTTSRRPVSQAALRKVPRTLSYRNLPSRSVSRRVATRIASSKPKARMRSVKASVSRKASVRIAQQRGAFRKSYTKVAASRFSKTFSRKLSTRVAFRNRPSRFASGNHPVQIASRNLPAQIASRNIPARIASRNLPVQIASRNLPARIASRNLPARIASRNLPAQIASRNLPVRIASHKDSPQISSDWDPLPTAESNPDVSSSLNSSIRITAMNELPRIIATTSSNPELLRFTESQHTTSATPLWTLPTHQDLLSTQKQILAPQTEMMATHQFILKTQRQLPPPQRRYLSFRSNLLSTQPVKKKIAKSQFNPLSLLPLRTLATLIAPCPIATALTISPIFESLFNIKSLKNQIADEKQKRQMMAHKTVTKWKASNRRSMRMKIASSALFTAKKMHSVGYCYRGVTMALKPLGINLTGMAAYMAKDQLDADPRFQKVEVAEIAELHPGDLIVHGPTNSHPYGHIGVYLGNETEASDHVQKTFLKGPYSGVSIFRYEPTNLDAYTALGLNDALDTTATIGETDAEKSAS